MGCMGGGGNNKCSLRRRHRNKLGRARSHPRHATRRRPRPVYRTNAIVGATPTRPTLVEVLVVWGDDEVVPRLVPSSPRKALHPRDPRRRAPRLRPPDHAGPALTLVAHDGERAVLHDPCAATSRCLPPRWWRRVGSSLPRSARGAERAAASAAARPAPRRDAARGVRVRGADGGRDAPGEAGRHRRRPGRRAPCLVALLHRNTTRALPPSLPDPTARRWAAPARARATGAAGIRSAPQAQRRWRTPRRGPAVDERIDATGGGRERLASVQQRGIRPLRAWAAPGASHAAGRSRGDAGDGQPVRCRRGRRVRLRGPQARRDGLGGGGHAADLVGLGRIQCAAATRTGRAGARVRSCVPAAAARRCGGTGTLRSGVARFGARPGAARRCAACRRRWARGVRCAGGGRGLLDPAAIRRVVLRNRGQVERCYERALEVNAGTAGRDGALGHRARRRGARRGRRGRRRASPRSATAWRRRRGAGSSPRRGAASSW